MIRFKEIQVFLGSCKEENKHIEKDVGWEEGQIFEKTGITTRVISAHDEGTELLASKSSKKLKSSLNGINLIISVTNTPSKNFPGISKILIQSIFLNKSKYILVDSSSELLSIIIISNSIFGLNVNIDFIHECSNL